MRARVDAKNAETARKQLQKEEAREARAIRSAAVKKNIDNLGKEKAMCIAVVHTRRKNGSYLPSEKDMSSLFWSGSCGFVSDLE